MPLTGDFTFVLIPSNTNESITEIQASKSGGLEKDALLQYANQYFATQHQQQQQPTSSAIIDTSVNITAITVPTKDNSYMACSIYSINYQLESNNVINKRATDLMTACGHTVVTTTTSNNNNSSDGNQNNTGGNAIYGDAFCGRAYDDERFEWERLDITTNEIDVGAEWCRTARKVGGGGGTGRTTTASLSNLAQQISNQNTLSSNNADPMEIVQDNNTTTNVNNYGMDGIEPVIESWGTWIQSNEEVEIKIVVPIQTTSKQCQIRFHKHHIQVIVNNETMIDGTTYDPIAIDESTYTIQDMISTNKSKNEISSSSSEKPQQGQRELCITIGKVETGRTWMYIAK